MSTAAIVMMSLAILLVWGGLAVSAVHLLRHPDDSSGDLAIEDELAPAVLSLIHISEPTRRTERSRMPSSA